MPISPRSSLLEVNPRSPRGDWRTSPSSNSSRTSPTDKLLTRFAPESRKKYALSLELSDAGFDFSVLSEFRARLLASNTGQVLLGKLLEQFTQRGLLKARGKQRTD